MEDQKVVIRASLLFDSLMTAFSDYEECEAGPEKEVRRDMLTQQLGRMSGTEHAITLLFVFDILHKIGAETVLELLRKWDAENPAEAETA